LIDEPITNPFYRFEIGPRRQLVLDRGQFIVQRSQHGTPAPTSDAAYLMANAVRLTGPLDVKALESGFSEVIRRHETLRTSFSTIKGQRVQVIAEQLTMTLPVLDLSHLPRDRREAQVQRYIAEELQLPFDLTRSPLIRARLLRLDTADHVLLMTMHHHITDGWSMSVLTQELSALYQAFSTNQPFTRADLQLQYDEALFESSTIKRLLSAFESLLSDIAAHPKAHLLSLQLFGSKYLQSSTD
jgi:NRPS condensation-like uncharacterized protein